MWVDQISFFEPMDDHKLPRILGKKKAGWFDRFKNARNIIKTLLFVGLLTVII